MIQCECVSPPFIACGRCPERTRPGPASLATTSPGELARCTCITGSVTMAHDGVNHRGAAYFLIGSPYLTVMCSFKAGYMICVCMEVSG